MVDFMKWALTDGQKFAADLGYAPLPQSVVDAGDEGAREDQGLVDGDAVRSSDDLGFRLGTGAFAAARCC